MNIKIKKILEKIDELEKFKNDSQNDLLLYCKNKSIPLKERWEIWETYCIKQEENSIVTPEEFNNPLLKYVCEVINNSYDIRCGIVDYYNFINCVEYFDEDDYERIPQIIRDIKIEFLLKNKNFIISNVNKINNIIVSFLKEAIIEENFGSYIYDW